MVLLFNTYKAWYYYSVNFPDCLILTKHDTTILLMFLTVFIKILTKHDATNFPDCLILTKHDATAGFIFLAV